MSKELERTGRPAGFAHGELDLLTASAKARNVALWHVLTVERRLPEDVVASALSESLGFSRVRLDAVQVQPEALKLLPPPVARKYVCLPLELTDRKLVLAMANPQDIHAIDAVQSVTDRRVHPVVATRREILKGIDRHYAQISTAPRVFAETDLAPADEASQPAEAAAIVAVCHQILFAAVKADASDVHIEPGPTGVRVRLRVDGMLRDYLDLPVWMQRQLLSRIKVLASLDIAQQRLPQDGRIKARSRDGAIDVRVSTLPTQYGEKIVLRVLGSSAAPSLLDLGLSDTQFAVVDEALHQPSRSTCARFCGRIPTSS
ncbi:MAG TPA: ATPase, T2SS/T4P/T4SS family [Vicinamibacterales bacterium]|nr:ATPase, T2SS/T4P/T4SS family [Vicinamibacterales bacterium]